MLLSTEQYNRLTERLKNCENGKIRNDDDDDKKEPGAGVETEGKKVADVAHTDPVTSHIPPSSQAHTPSSRPQSFNRVGASSKLPKKRDDESKNFQESAQKDEEKLQDKISKKTPPKSSAAKRTRVKQQRKPTGVKTISKEAIIKKLSPPGISSRKGVAKIQRRRKWVRLVD